MYDKAKAQELLMELQKAKSDAARLSDEYRKVCECNEYIGGVKPDHSLKSTQYMKTHKTCKYHEVRIYHSGPKPMHPEMSV